MGPMELAKRAAGRAGGRVDPRAAAAMTRQLAGAQAPAVTRDARHGTRFEPGTP